MTSDGPSLGFSDAALDFVIESMRGRDCRGREVHVPELTNFVAAEALERFGPLARLVLDHFGLWTDCDVAAAALALTPSKRLILSPNETEATFLAEATGRVLGPDVDAAWRLMFEKDPPRMVA